MKVFLVRRVLEQRAKKDHRDAEALALPREPHESAHVGADGPGDPSDNDIVQLSSPQLSAHSRISASLSCRWNASTTFSTNVLISLRVIFCLAAISPSRHITGGCGDLLLACGGG